MAVTSIDIDPELLTEVKQVTGAKSNREAIETALKTLSREALLTRQREIALDVINNPLTDDEMHPQKIDYPVDEEPGTRQKGAAA